VRKPLLAAALLAATLIATAARADIILSELCDPQNNYTTDRFIEIWNSGPGAVDLTSWSVVAVANNVDVCTWTLSGTIAAGQAKVCGGPSTVTGFTVDFVSSVWATPAGYMNWNGKVGDGAKLKNGSGTVIDYIIAPSTGLFENEDLVRNANITSPNPVSTVSEWTATPVTLATDASPGSHNGSLPPPGGPIISNVVTDPAVPTADAGTDVQADVVDTTSAILGVTLAWGTSSGSQPNVIGMTVLSGNTYRTSAPIPAQSNVTVYYRVSAQDSLQTSNSSLKNYTLGTSTSGAPTVLQVGQTSDSTLLVFFSEAVDPASAQTPSHYTVGALVATGAVRDPVQTSQVSVTIPGIAAGTQTLSVSGVADVQNNVDSGVTKSFNWVDVSIPPGYYNGTAGLMGSALRLALHNIIKNHTVKSYDYALTAFATTDVKANGKIWDMYSDVPGGTPPYEYSVGQTGQGATEGLGYNREHSFPQSWFGGASPMVSDLWILYPTDAKVNGYRSNYAYGVVASATTTSLNGSKLGSSASPGFSGTVFEPIDGYKGDLARGQFYVSTRYFTEDAGWPGGPESVGANLLPWAANQYLAWSQADPVSWKERLRNGAVYVIQHNRNPFVDHPEFVAMIWDTTSVIAGVDAGPQASVLSLRQNQPNPFAGGTTIRFDLPRRATVSLAVYDISGREVRALVHGSALEAGIHATQWDGRDARGAACRAGVYFCRLSAGDDVRTSRMVLAR